MADMRTVYAGRRQGSRIEGPVPVPFVFATFHVTLLVLTTVGGLHHVMALGDLLSALSTPLGLGAFAYLWILTWLVTRRILDRISITHATEPGGGRALLRAGVRGGGLVGVAFVSLPVLRFAAGAGVDGSLGPALLVLVIGLALGGIGGAVVGSLSAVLDVLVVRGVDRVVTGPRTRP